MVYLVSLIAPVVRITAKFSVCSPVTAVPSVGVVPSSVVDGMLPPELFVPVLPAFVVFPLLIDSFVFPLDELALSVFPSDVSV